VDFGAAAAASEGLDQTGVGLLTFRESCYLLFQVCVGHSMENTTHAQVVNILYCKCGKCVLHSEIYKRELVTMEVLNIGCNP